MRGVECVEGDFHLTKDEVIVCMHDANVKRTCGVDRPLAEMTLAEVKELDCGVLKSPEWKFTRVPTLEEILRGMPDDGEIFIELKSAGRILDKMEELFARAGRRAEQLTFISFDADIISKAKKRFPTHQTYWLYSNGLEFPGDHPPYTLSPDELVDKLRELGVDGIDSGVVAKAVRLTLLSTKIVHKLILGESDLTTTVLRKSFPPVWEKQEKELLK